MSKPELLISLTSSLLLFSSPFSRCHHQWCIRIFKPWPRSHHWLLSFPYFPQLNHQIVNFTSKHILNLSASLHLHCSHPGPRCHYLPSGLLQQPSDLSSSFPSNFLHSVLKLFSVQQPEWPFETNAVSSLSSSKLLSSYLGSMVNSVSCSLRCYINSLSLPFQPHLVPLCLC